MAKTQQDVAIYNDKSFSTAQSQFEKDLKKHQREGWRLVSVTPTKKRAFGRIIQLTAIYERDVVDDGGTAATRAQEKAREAATIAGNKAKAQAQELAIIAENMAKAKAERQEAQRIAREREQAYQDSLSPEQLQQYLKRKRRKSLIVTAIIIGSLILCIAAIANNPAMKELSNAALTPVPTDTPVPPTPIPTFQDRLKQTVPDSNLKQVNYDAKTKSVVVIYYISTFWNHSNAIDMVKITCFDAQKSLWTSDLKSKFADTKVVLQSDLVDRYGNKSVGNIGTCELFTDTAHKFNWDGLDQNSAWDVYDLTWLLPDLKNPD